MSEATAPERARSGRQNAFALAVLGLGVAALVANGAIGVRNAADMIASYDWVTHTHEVIEASQQLLSTLQDAETGQRGFLITGGPSYLAPYEASVAAVRDQLGRLEQLTSDNPEQQRRLDALRPVVERKLDELRRTIELRQREPGGFDAARALVATDEGKALMDDLRGRSAALTDEERRLESERERRFDADSRGAIVGDLLGTLASVALVGWGFLLTRRHRRERERAADLLAAESERLRTTLTSIGDAVIVTDDRGEVNVFNEVAEALTGWTAREAVGRPLSQVLHIVDEESRTPAASPVERVLREGVVVGLANHTALVAKDGTVRPIADSGAPVRDPHGRIAGVVLVFRDQTEERRRQEAILRSRQGLGRLADASLRVVRETDVRGMVQAISEAVRMLTEGRVAICGYGDAGGQPERTFLVRGGLGLDLVLTDDARGSLADEDASLLRQLATIASLALDHVEARGSLESADRSKNEFLAMLSHELRNPLAPIRNSLYILDRAAPGGEQARRAQAVIDRQVVHLTRLVDDLLDVTRISRGKIQLRRERLDLGDMVHRAADDHRSGFAQNGLDLQVSVPEAPVWIHGDRTRVLQVLGNLLQNSTKFTEPGGRVSVSLAPDASLGQAVVRVRDTGVGIAREMLSRVFEPFAQADTTLDRSKGGLGLGLALVKALIEMHGGAVTVDSEGLGKGAEFVMRLPLDTAPHADGPAGRVARAVRPRHVLVIEDNRDAAESLRDVLLLGNHTVAVAYSGPDGLERARAFPPEVVLCDIGLPGMDGYEVARAIRADPALRSARLVALTGYAGAEDVSRAREAGFDAHIAKPPSLQALEDVLADGTSTELVRSE